MTTSPLMNVALLRGHAPYTLAGFTAFRSVIETDGAIAWTLTGGSPSDDIAYDLALGPGREITLVGAIAGEALFQGVALTPKEDMDAFVWRAAAP